MLYHVRQKYKYILNMAERKYGKDYRIEVSEGLINVAAVVNKLAPISPELIERAGEYIGEPVELLIQEIFGLSSQYMVPLDPLREEVEESERDLYRGKSSYILLSEKFSELRGKLAYNLGNSAVPAERSAVAIANFTVQQGYGFIKQLSNLVDFMLGEDDPDKALVHIRAASDFLMGMTVIPRPEREAALPAKRDTGIPVGFDYALMLFNDPHLGIEEVRLTPLEIISQVLGGPSGLEKMPSLYRTFISKITLDARLIVELRKKIKEASSELGEPIKDDINSANDQAQAVAADGVGVERELRTALRNQESSKEEIGLREGDIGYFAPRAIACGKYSEASLKVLDLQDEVAGLSQAMTSAEHGLLAAGSEVDVYRNYLQVLNRLHAGACFSLVASSSMLARLFGDTTALITEMQVQGNIENVRGAAMRYNARISKIPELVAAKVSNQFGLPEIMAGDSRETPLIAQGS